MKKLISVLLALVLVLGTFSMAFAAEDTPILISAPADSAALPNDLGASPDYLQKAVLLLMNAGAITGDVDGNYHPDDNLTRAQVCCILIKYLDPAAVDITGTVTVNPGTAKFSDMGGYGWAAPYINFAASNSIALGYPGNTFKPGNNVTLAELITFVVRTAGYTDQTLGGTWPQNYVDKAAELGFFANLDDVKAMSIDELKTTKATKAEAAVVTANASAKIDEVKNQAKPDLPQGGDKDGVDKVPVLSEYTFVSNGSFDADFRTYNNKSFAKDVQLLVYGARKEYKSDMTAGTKKSDYRESTVYKYKNVTTPAFVKYNAAGQIESIIVPGNVGFSGKIYCVVKAAQAQTINFDDETVTEIETITAGRELSWFAKKGLDVSPLSKTNLQPGTLVELTAKNGEITAIAYVLTEDQTPYGTPSGKKFVLVKGGTIADKDSSSSLIKFADDEWYTFKDNAVVYVYDKSDKEYTSASKSALKKGEKAFLYDISDDKKDEADIVVIVRD